MAHLVCFPRIAVGTTVLTFAFQGNFHDKLVLYEFSGKRQLGNIGGRNSKHHVQDRCGERPSDARGISIASSTTLPANQLSDFYHSQVYDDEALPLHLCCDGCGVGQYSGPRHPENNKIMASTYAKYQRYGRPKQLSSDLWLVVPSSWAFHARYARKGLRSQEINAADANCFPRGCSLRSNASQDEYDQHYSVTEWAGANC